ncbi:PD-(D/E)XK motif protein [Bacteroides fragilis]
MNPCMLNVFIKKRNEKCYKVLADFPRIMENDLRNGVSNVVYAISIGMCDEYLVSEGVLFNTIK